MSYFEYTGDRLKEARFPLGGIGAGNIAIDGGARLVDWEIMNRPNKESYNAFSHIAVKAERGGEVMCARVLNGPLAPPYMGKGLHAFGGYSYGPPRETMAGVPHFDGLTLTGRFPLAEYEFSGDFPARVKLSAFSPFEPNNDFDSSLPLAMFEIAFHNDTGQPLDYSAAFTVANPNRLKPRNLAAMDGGRARILFATAETDENKPSWGQACVETDCRRVSWQSYWYRGMLFDGLNVFWQDFTRPGPFKERLLPLAEGLPENAQAPVEHGVLCAMVGCAPGETARVRFALSWYYPNYEKYWAVGEKPVWRNWYATVFSGAAGVAAYALENWGRLSGAVNSFVDALYNSSMPPEAVDAAGSTLAVLKSPTCLRLTDGGFYGWEGSHARDGSCEGSCQHVWNYQYALPMLFPALERSMREMDYACNLQPDGSMPFRLQLPPGSPPWQFGPCADGQLGGVIKSYREWKLCGDDGWLRGLWPGIKRSLEYAWSPGNLDKWDIGQTGVLTGRQHHTLDTELIGPNSWLTGIYLAALEAAARMAGAMGDGVFAAKCRALKAKGSDYAEKNLWNGEYYAHKIDLGDKSALEPYAGARVLFGGDIMNAYWNEEAGEVKYQIGEGSSIDQLLGQWHADLCGLGDIFDRERVKTALGSIYNNNFAEKMGVRFNPCRLYCLQDESGLVICAYPEGVRRPVISVPYAEETMHGFEYAAACQMIMNGLEQEGLRCVRAVRSRYDGCRRNPWNEIECGGNYARSMAAWSLVQAYQGVTVDMTTGEVGLGPIIRDKPYSGIWSFGGAWGKLAIAGGKVTMECYGGEVAINRLKLLGKIVFDGHITLKPGSCLETR